MHSRARKREHWQAYVSNSGDLFYVNLDTGKTTQKKPNVFTWPDMQWIAHKDRLTGKYYFEHIKSQTIRRKAPRSLSRIYRKMVLRQSEMVFDSRNALVHGFTREHSLECPVDVVFVIIKFYFADFDSDAQTPLLAACKYGYHRVISRLLEVSKISINERNIRGMTALHIAARSGFDDVCAVLLNHGIDVDSIARKKATALGYAVKKGHVRVVKTLLQHHADVNINNLTISPLMRACQWNHHEIAKLLLDTGNISSREDVAISLGEACHFGATECVEHLLTCSPAHLLNVNQCNPEGLTPLCNAARKGHCDIATLLLQYGADVNQTLQGKELAVTPLCIAVVKGHIEMVRVLLSHSEIDINAHASDGETPLMLAAKFGRAAIVRDLLRRGADPLRSSAKGMNAFGYAARHGHCEILKQLYKNATKCQGSHRTIQMHLNLVTDMDKGWTPLHLACIGGHEEVAKFLIINAKVSVQKRDFANKTALYYASKSGNASLRSWLTHWVVRQRQPHCSHSLV